MARDLLESIKGNAAWDFIKEALKLMLPFLAGLGIREWVAAHSIALMWVAAFIVAATIAFGDRLAAKRSRDFGGKLQIHSAVYGTGPVDEIDVTDRLRECTRDAMAVSVNNNLFGQDPAPNVPKRLEIEYSYGNKFRKKLSRPENCRLVLPEDSFVEQELLSRERRIDEMRAEHSKAIEQVRSEEQTRFQQWKERRDPMRTDERVPAPAVIQSPPSPAMITLGLRLLMRESKSLLTAYRRLHHDAPDEVKLPINHASWPNFQPATTWKYEDIMLCCLKTRFCHLQANAKCTWEELGWPDRSEVFQVNEGSIMPEVLEALSSFHERMRLKVPEALLGKEPIY